MIKGILATISTAPNGVFVTYPKTGLVTRIPRSRPGKINLCRGISGSRKTAWCGWRNLELDLFGLVMIVIARITNCYRVSHINSNRIGTIIAICRYGIRIGISIAIAILVLIIGVAMGSRARKDANKQSIMNEGKSDD